MRLFRVICLSVGGKHRVFNHNDIMLERDFESDQADKYVESEHVEEVTESEAMEFGYVPDHSFEHVVTSEDIANNPGGELKEGETIVVPKEPDTKPKKNHKK